MSCEGLRMNLGRGNRGCDGGGIRVKPPLLFSEFGDERTDLERFPFGHPQETEADAAGAAHHEVGGHPEGLAFGLHPDLDGGAAFEVAARFDEAAANAEIADFPGEAEAAPGKNDFGNSSASVAGRGAPFRSCGGVSHPCGVYRRARMKP